MADSKSQSQLMTKPQQTVAVVTGVSVILLLLLIWPWIIGSDLSLKETGAGILIVGLIVLCTWKSPFLRNMFGFFCVLPAGIILFALLFAFWMNVESPYDNLEEGEKLKPSALIPAFLSGPSGGNGENGRNNNQQQTAVRSAAPAVGPPTWITINNQRPVRVYKVSDRFCAIVPAWHTARVKVVDNNEKYAELLLRDDSPRFVEEAIQINKLVPRGRSWGGFPCDRVNYG